MTQFIIAETKIRLLQQILAHDSGVLSIEELNYRNTDLDRNSITSHVQEIECQSIVQRLTADSCPDDLPCSYWTVSESGIKLLQQWGLFREVAVLSEADDALKRSARIKKIESEVDRPRPDWYERFE